MPAQRLLIPDIGTKLVLAEDWTFRLHWERRNESLWKALGLIQQEQLRIVYQTCRQGQTLFPTT